MISAETAYKTAERFNEKLEKKPVDTIEQLIDESIYDAACRGLMSVDIQLKYWHLTYIQRSQLIRGLIRNRYSVSQPRPGSMRIAWQNYLLR